MFDQAGLLCQKERGLKKLRGGVRVRKMGVLRVRKM